MSLLGSIKAPWAGRERPSLRPNFIADCLHYVIQLWTTKGPKGDRIHRLQKKKNDHHIL